MSDYFQITNKHYQTILKQGRDNYPQEIGGFLGGKNGLISAILPIFNQHLYNKTDTFAFTSEDVTRAHQFFDKHGLGYYGLYHTHPKGIAYPSKEDILSGQQYHFILSLRDDAHPVFKAFKVVNKQVIEVPLVVIEDKGFSSKDIHQGANTEPAHLIHPAFRGKSPHEESADLSERIGNILDLKENTYDVMPPKDIGNSDFSTLA